MKKFNEFFSRFQALTLLQEFRIFCELTHDNLYVALTLSGIATKRREGLIGWADSYELL